MRWDLPLEIEIDGKNYPIRNKCDYRVVLDVICALNDNELSNDEKIRCALFIFYENLNECENLEKAIKEMYYVISGGQEENESSEKKPRLMDWEHDFPHIAPPVSRVLGYDVRMPDKYTHWYTFLGGYQEIGDCQFANIVSIRNKRAKGKKLESYEREFYNNNKKLIDLPMNLTEDEQDWLDGE